MPDLKTTKEERAALRADILDTFPDHGSLRQSREKSCLALLDDLDTIEQALEERDNDLHMRIRAGYDRCIADTWRAEVAKVKLRADTLEAEVERLRGERDALREVAEAAKDFVPTCDETTYDFASKQSHTCGKFATFMDRFNGFETNRLCTEHAIQSLESAQDAASKGYTRALDLDTPKPLESPAWVTRLHEALEALRKVQL